MKHKGLLLMTALVVCATSAIAVAQAGQEYEDPSGKFKLVLYGEWKAISYNDAVGRPKTEFIYRDRSEGLLKIARETLSGTIADRIRQEEENLKMYRVGFERASSEAFGGGGLNGMRLSFYSTESGRQTASTFYFLQDKNAVYILRFTGKRGMLDTNRNVTDQIARSFQAMTKQ
jgi:hypothetical protein